LLQVVGLAMFGGPAQLGIRHWFGIPFTGIAVSLACHVAGTAVSRL